MSVIFQRILFRHCPKCGSQFNRALGTAKKQYDPDNMAVQDYSAKGGKICLYGWGLVGNGEIGVKELLAPKEHPRALCYQRRPERIPLDNKYKIKNVACGHGFTVFTSSSKTDPRLFGTGLNAYGQLGYQTDVKTKSKFFEWLAEPRPIQLPLGQPKSTRISHVACGLSHTLVSTDQNEIIGLGNNCHGQCGRRIIEDEDYRSPHSVPHKIRGIKGKVQKLVCGLDHSLILTEDGLVYGFGLGTDGQLGDGKFLTRWEPMEIEGDLKNEKIVDISSSADCCMAVSDKGDVFGWGNSEYKQLSSVTTGIQVGTPLRLNFGLGKIKKVAVGGSACLILTEKGEVYSWGYGYLGHGPEIVMKASPTLLPGPLFGANAFNEDVKVVDIFASINNYAAINSKGELYLWGKNDWGSLGLGHDKAQYFPFKLDFGYTFVSVSLARFHTVAMIRTPR